MLTIEDGRDLDALDAERGSCLRVYIDDFRSGTVVTPDFGCKPALETEYSSVSLVLWAE